MNRRDLLSLLPAAGMPGAAWAAADATVSAAWDAWKTRFVTPEGRVVDGLQGDASHSEGQGWAMRLAVGFDDPRAFALLQSWTEKFLAVRRDPLLAWRWLPGEGVADFNNASDGDLFYAWALLLAARRFGDAALATRAGELARAIDAILVRDAPGGGLLLRPAAERFSEPGREVVNPSYVMPLALHALGAAFDLPRLGQVAADGEALIARIAERGLVPDWVGLDAAGWHPDASHGPLHGYDAIRVALYLAWSGRFAHPAVTRARTLFATRNDGIPVRSDPATGEVLERSDAPGYAALAAFVRRSGQPLPRSGMPDFTAAQPYYPATLHLLADLAARETSLAWR